MMIDRTFWRAARAAWIIPAEPEPKRRSENRIKETEGDLQEGGISFDLIDFDEAMDAALSGRDLKLHQDPESWQDADSTQQKAEPPVKDREAETKASILPDPEVLDRLMDQKTLSGYAACSRMLADCSLPFSLKEDQRKLEEGLLSLEKAESACRSVYPADLTEFLEYYIPEALQLAVSYLDYLAAAVAEDILEETEKEIMQTDQTLLTALQEKTEEIYQFASVELTAQARALDAMMGQDGYSESSYRINRRRD